MSIGENLEATGRIYEGFLDELRIWNVARTETEINLFKDCEILESSSGLVSYYKFNQGYQNYNNSYISTLDDALQNNNGILNNFTLNGATSNFLINSPVVSNATIPETPIVSSEVILYNLNDAAQPLTATTTANELLWYDSLTDTTSESSITPDTNIPGYQSYWVAASNGGNCESERVEIVVFIASGSGKSLHFDGIDDNLTTPNNSFNNTLNSGGVVSFYIKLEDVLQPGKVTIIDSDNWKINITVSGNLSFWTNNLDDIETAHVQNLKDDTWHHIIISFVPTSENTWSEKIYLDGLLVEERVMPFTFYPFSSSAAPINIGNFKGNIDELMLLSYLPNELIENPFCNATNPLSLGGLLSYYSFDKGVANGDNAEYDVFSGDLINQLIDPQTPVAGSGSSFQMNNFSYIGPESNFSDLEGTSDKPTIPTVTSPVEYFITESSLPLTATTANGNTLIWYLSETDITGSSTAPTPSTAATGTTSYWVSELHPSGCESDRAEIVVNVNSADPATHLMFDGVNDYINLGNSAALNFTNNFTIEFWMKAGGPPDLWDALIAKGDTSWRVALVPSGEVEFAGTNAFSIFSTTPVTDNTWHHIAVTYDGAYAKIYIDGVEEVSQAATNPVNITSFDVTIGENLEQPGRFYDGAMDELRIWNTARTASSINGSMSCELIGSEPNLISYYKFNQGLNSINNSSQTTLIDELNANTGNFSDFQLLGNDSNFVSGNTLSIVPELPTVQTPVTLYQGQTPVTLTATTNGDGLLWYSDFQNGVGTTTAPTPDVSNLGTTSYWVTSTNSNGCESEKQEVIVNVVIGTVGDMLNFNDGDDRVNCGNILTPSYTKEAMIYVNQFYAYNIIMAGSGSGSNHVFFAPNSNGKRLAASHNNNFSTVLVQDSEVLQVNTWYHVAVTYDVASTTMKLYKNGVLVDTNTNVPSYNNADSLIINSVGTANGVGFRGNYDEVRIWDYARDEYQIKSTMSCELLGNESGLVAYYKFNQGIANSSNTSVNQLIDSSGNGNNGELSGLALTGTTSNWLAGSPVITGSIIPSASTVTTPVTYTQGDTATPLTATTGTNGTGLLWYTTETGGTGTTTAPTPNTSTVGSTSYWVSSTNANGCESGRSEIVVNVEATLGLAHTNFLNTLTFYPNPTKDVITISNTNSYNLELEIHDLNGRLLLKTNKNNKSVSLDLSRYQSGVYMLKIKVNGSQIIKKIIKD